ncbi:MAG TPA: 50S ribosomal protein L15 [Candidatus Limnocylindria bacterium]|nr:50S ribosomal protein L15 [Candidatus Limnocylindria bacterium]
MKLHDLQPPSGSHKPARRVGRGHGSGRGKTAGRGTKGQKSRAGSSIPAWFEGGQTPLHVRTPKLHGFKNRFRVEYAGLNLGRLSDVAAGTLVTPDVLRHDGLLRSSKTHVLPVKILGGGDAPKGVTIHAHAFTRSALEKLQAAGSTAQRISWPDGLPIDETAEAKEAAATEAATEAKAEKRAAKADAKAAKGGIRKRTPDEPVDEAPAEAAADGAPAAEASGNEAAPEADDSDDATNAGEDES